MLDRKRKNHGHSNPGVRRGSGFGVTTLTLALLVSAGSSVAPAGASDFELDPVVSSGFRCETRHRTREILRRQFVLDRTTECRPMLVQISRGSSLRLLPKAVHVEPANGRSLGDPEVEAAAADTEGSEASGDVAKWSADRRRLGNAQYDRSLRAMRGSLSRTAR